MEKVNSFIRARFEAGTFEKAVWVHDECAKPIVTYTDPTNGYGYKYFQDEDLAGTPSLVQVKELVKEGWENKVDTTPEAVVT